MSVRCNIITELPSGKFIVGYIERNGGRWVGNILNQISHKTSIKICEYIQINDIQLFGGDDDKWYDEPKQVGSNEIYIHDVYLDGVYRLPPGSPIIYDSLDGLKGKDVGLSLDSSTEEDMRFHDYNYVYYVNGEIHVYNFTEYKGLLRDYLNNPNY